MRRHTFGLRAAVARRMLAPAPALLAALALSAATLRAQDSPPPCTSDSAFAQLDFWVGSWDVFVRDARVGSDVIRKVLDGCALTEDWTDARGRHGHSLFYYQVARRAWKQVWVTDHALGRGGVKEKELVARLPDGGVRFQGAIPTPDGGSYLDRTTLTPAGPDRVRQVIEVSTDGGAHWRTTFDAMYVRRP